MDDITNLEPLKLLKSPEPRNPGTPSKGPFKNKSVSSISIENKERDRKKAKKIQKWGVGTERFYLVEVMKNLRQFLKMSLLFNL